ncbi:hypothetical protein K402DRAFT_397989, partial [Aulographum hederae CBS 113979]
MGRKAEISISSREAAPAISTTTTKIINNNEITEIYHEIHHQNRPHSILNRSLLIDYRQARAARDSSKRSVTGVTRLGLPYHWQANHLTRGWIPDLRAELRRDPRIPREHQIRFCFCFLSSSRNVLLIELTLSSRNRI